ncbi:GGDEF domain-containing protein [Rhodococcus sp. 06-221-2]|nr:hypothetical protein ASH04_13395 [Rhodococcus sp. Leaf233]OZD06318.1 GGDEF domain-containing protein [Rhodococcus sp. 06-221-2]
MQGVKSVRTTLRPTIHFREGGRWILLSVLALLAVANGAGLTLARSATNDRQATEYTSWWFFAALVVAILGLASLATPNAGNARHSIALSCAATLPPCTLVTQGLAMLQMWGLVSILFLAIYIRVFYPARTARLLVCALAATAVISAVLSPTPSPLVWIGFYLVSVSVAAEVFGAMGATLIDGALRDPLTGALNRAGAAHAASHLLARTRKRGENLVVIVLDVDDFKAVNDCHGHAEGDRILVELARSWMTSLAPSDVLVRLGGDEFAVLTTGCSRSEAEALASSLVDGHVVEVSYGVAIAEPETDPYGILISIADSELYCNKRFRRNHCDGTSGGNSCDADPPIAI